MAEAMAPRSATRPRQVAPSTPAAPRDYFSLLKPRVMSLVVFTAATGLFCADTPIHPFIAVIAILCIAVGAGASGALNMAYDSDIDALMRRTRGRAVPSGRIGRSEAAGFGVVLGLLSVILMGLAVNFVAAGLLAFTIVFYALVYTVWLKRATPQNIVIGGAAGALPPVIGWAAATGTTPLDAWLLFAIIFMWTPPHFWALSLYTTGDYAKAGVPMMPVVRGARSTRRQIFGYSLVFVPLAIAPVFTGLGHLLYAAVSIGGGAVFLLLAARILGSKAGEAMQPDPVPGEAPATGNDRLYAVKADAKAARDLFAFSILYLLGLFAALLVEHSLMRTI